MTYGFIGLCWMAWLPFFLRQVSQVHADFWIQRFQRWDLAYALYQMFVEPENAALQQTPSLWTLDLCVLGWVVLLWRPRVEAVYAAACAWTPIGLAIAASSFGMHVFLFRYLLFAHLFFLAGIAMLVARIPGRIERRLVAGLVASWGLFAWWAFCEGADFPKYPGAEPQQSGYRKRPIRRTR